MKLLDYREKWSELEASTNPFASVVMAHLKAVETKGDNEQRYRWKLILIKRLYRQGYAKADGCGSFGSRIKVLNNDALGALRTKLLRFFAKITFQ